MTFDIGGIRVYDATNQLYQLSQQLSGPGLSERSVIGELMRVTDVIKRLSPLYEEEYDAGVDWEESRIRKVLDGEGRSIRRKKKQNRNRKLGELQ